MALGPTEFRAYSEGGDPHRGDGGCLGSRSDFDPGAREGERGHRGEQRQSYDSYLGYFEVKHLAGIALNGS